MDYRQRFAACVPVSEAAHSTGWAARREASSMASALVHRGRLTSPIRQHLACFLASSRKHAKCGGHWIAPWGERRSREHRRYVTTGLTVEITCRVGVGIVASTGRREGNEGYFLGLTLTGHLTAAPNRPGTALVVVVVAAVAAASELFIAGTNSDGPDMLHLNI